MCMSQGLKHRLYSGKCWGGLCVWCVRVHICVSLFACSRVCMCMPANASRHHYLSRFFIRIKCQSNYLHLWLTPQPGALSLLPHATCKPGIQGCRYMQDTHNTTLHTHLNFQYTVRKMWDPMAKLLAHRYCIPNIPQMNIITWHSERQQAHQSFAASSPDSFPLLWRPFFVILSAWSVL